ncbi:hypothetical protein [Brachyspira pilosicoli]|uniref:hypothetical protein n=1 Tax=Brachyspira pilosicoli TaxID=52584 RepID=UPI003003C7C6
MKKLIFIFFIILNCSALYAQSPYSEKEQNLLKGVISVWPYIGLEPIRPTKSYIPYDYIHESYKRDNPDPRIFSSRLLYELSTIEIHMNTVIGVNLKNGYFSMPNMYFSVGKSFHYDWIFSATPFVTLSSKLNVFSENGKVKANGNIEVYDAGIETVTLTRLLLSFRMKAVNDINESTFMLLPSVVDSSAESFEDVPHWYLPRINNAMGFRTGFIGHYYEISYSQGFTENSSPLAAVFKINGDYFKLQFLYQYNKNSSLSPEAFDNNNINYSLENEYTHHIIQLYAMGKVPFLNNELWLNMLGEYTWRDNDAHYLRFELGLEWKMLNIAIRPLFYIPIDNKDGSIHRFDKDKDLFCLEYSAYVKFDPIYFGFQGSTDGRYYIAMKALF